MSDDAWKVAVYRRLPRRLRVLASRYATPNFTVGAVALITRDGSSVLLVRTTYRKGWVPPGGFLDRGESPMEALEREIAEELGVSMTFLPVHRVALDVPRQGITFVSVGVAPVGAEFRIGTSELAEIAWFALDGLPALSRDFTEGITAEDLQAIREAGARGPLTNQ